MAIIRATAVVERVSGEDKDASRNVWHFATPAAVIPQDLTDIGTALSTFYNALGVDWSPDVSRAAGAHRIELAQVTVGAPGAADDTVSKLLGTFPFQIFGAAASATPLPNEVAAVLSFRGDITGVPEEAGGGVTRPASRRRGRVFLGPFNSSVIEAGDQGEPRLKQTFGTRIFTAYDDMRVDLQSDATHRIQHVVYSRADGVHRPVTHVSMNDEPDTVRRRTSDRNVKLLDSDVAWAI